MVISGTTLDRLSRPMLSVRPKGNPSACTGCPGASTSESPSGRYGWFTPVTKSTARSRSGSVAAIEASTQAGPPLRALAPSGGMHTSIFETFNEMATLRRPSSIVISLLLTTWSLVSTWPSGEMTKPLPVPISTRSRSSVRFRPSSVMSA